MLRHCRHYNVGLDDQEFRNFAGIVSDRIFNRFFQFAESNMKRRMPLLITGGCGLNCDWNTKWKKANLFPEVFVPPVANDSGSAIGTAIDAQFHFTGNPKINWNVYSGFPQARFLVRLDGGFATPEVFDFLDAEPRLDYVVAMAKNAVLERQASSAMQAARAQSEATGETAHVYTAARYAARTWGHERRVVIKAEVVRLGERAPRDNPRFVVTNLRQTPRFIYERVYCARGDIENRIKELLDGLQIDRTSCCRFWANQLRVLLTAAAYVLMQELRLRAARTACARMPGDVDCATGC